MVSAYVVSSEGSDLHSVAADLESVGIDVLGSGGAQSMVQGVIRAAPDLVVCYETHPEDALFAGIDALNRSAPRPVVVFTTDPDAEKIERATRSGIHAYVVNGYGAGRLRSIIHVAQARFRYVEVLRNELADVNHRFSERKLIDQAKAILMRLRNLPEDEAYATLRTAAMKANKRMGQVARQVIDAARYGEAINRAGQLRMTSQRLVKLYALLCEDPPATARPLFQATLAQMDGNLASLGRSLSKPTYGDLLASVAAPAAALRAAVAEPPGLRRLQAIDLLAERVLLEAEQLATTLESVGYPAALRLINVAGRQRMLSQRYAKQALLAAMLEAGTATPQAQASLAETATAYRAAMVYLDAVPLRTPAIAALFVTAAEAWTALQAAVPAALHPAGRPALLEASETLLASFEALTEHYERNLQALLQT